ncbi:MAG: SDR family oxidoreductase [Verrucomicrobiota bacterium]|nr:SDR family oxidoreductase [Verrucomicrobiota bacterium]
MKLDGCTALITGASAGIGREFARQLAPRASALVLVARRQERLEELRDELEARSLRPASKGAGQDDGGATTKAHITLYRADLSRPEEIGGLAQWLTTEKVALDLLINNAGVGDRGDFANAELQRVQDMLRVNVVALTELTRGCLPAMIAQRRGAILNVSSCASFLPMPAMAVYAATKAYVTSFSEAIRTELQGTGVTVTALCPGPVHTEFASIAARGSDVDQQIAPGFTHVSVENVVRDGLDGIEAERAIVIPGAVMKLGMLLVRLTPRAILRLAMRLGR